MPRLESTGVLWVLIHSNAALIFITTILLKLIFPTCWVEGNLHGCFQSGFQSSIPFHVYFDSAVHIFPTSEKNHAFFIWKSSYTQFDTCRRFYPPIYAEWLPLNRGKVIITEAILAIYTEVKFYPKVKSQTGLSSLRVSCKRALSNYCVS